MKTNRYILMAILLVVAVFSFETYFLEPKSEMLRASIEQQYDVLQKYERFIEGEGMTEEEISVSIDEMKKIEKRLFHEESNFLAAVKLQKEGLGLMSKAGLRVLIIKPLSSEKINNYSKVSVFFEGEGDIKQVSDFLKLVESDKFLIKIDKLSLRVADIKNQRRLKFKIRVSGLNII